jgi:hypothetical protein
MSIFHPSNHSQVGCCARRWSVRLLVAVELPLMEPVDRGEGWIVSALSAAAASQ